MGNTIDKNTNYENAAMTFNDKEKLQLQDIYHTLCENQDKVLIPKVIVSKEHGCAKIDGATRSPLPLLVQGRSSSPTLVRHQGPLSD